MTKSASVLKERGRRQRRNLWMRIWRTKMWRRILRETIVKVRVSRMISKENPNAHHTKCINDILKPELVVESGTGSCGDDTCGCEVDVCACVCVCVCVCCGIGAASVVTKQFKPFTQLPSAGRIFEARNSNHRSWLWEGGTSKLSNALHRPSYLLKSLL